MKIAFTHNLQMTQNEEEAEFDRPDTIQAITAALERLGHEVELIEVSGPASRLVSRLESLHPTIVFNTAEGRYGKYREAFYPGLFDQLGLPYTGSDAYVCTLTLDKVLTKTVLSTHGILTPKWHFVSSLADWPPPDLRYPVMVKPNFEGSSKGITQQSIVENPEELHALVQNMLRQYPTGLLIEEYIEGRDICVPFLEKASPNTHGVLPASEYVFNESMLSGRKYNIYDYQLKHYDCNAVSVRSPADLTKAQSRELGRISRKIYQVLGIRDLGRIDYRVTPEGEIYFIEINALPSLEPGAGIYISAEQAGLESMDDVLKAVLRSAAQRQSIRITKRKSIRNAKLKVGLTYNLKRIKPKNTGDDDIEAEYDSQATVDAISEAIKSFGHEVIPLEATPELPGILQSTQLDIVFNIAEGIRGRNREAHIPSMLELLDIEYTGSDPATLAVTLDKALAKRVLIPAGIPTPGFYLMRTGKEKIPKHMRFPLILKPNQEGSSKGVTDLSVVQTPAALKEVGQALLAKYHQPVLVEEYLSGREFTIGLLGEIRPKVLPPMEIVFTNPRSATPVYSFAHKQELGDEIRYDTPADVAPKLGKELAKVARAAFMALGCSDVARIDLRLDAKGKVHFIECNPLPGLTPDWSDLCLIAKSAGMDYRTLVSEIMAPAIKRLRMKRKRQTQIERVER